MKRIWLYLLLSTTIVAMPLTSCEKNNKESQKEEGKHDPHSDTDQTPLVAHDALAWLQDNIVVAGEDDEIIRRIYGKPLEQSQPDILSVPVPDYESAEKIFLSWVAPGKEANKIEGGYEYDLTDDKGNPQGCVVFRHEDGEEGVKARMTVEEGTDLKHVSEVKFIDKDLWPENAEYPVYEAGKTYVLDDYEIKWTELGDITGSEFNYDGAKSKPMTFYCIQGNTDGKVGILVWLSPDTNDSEVHPRPYYYIRDKAYNYLPSVVEAQKVLDFFNSNNQFWNKMLREMDEKGYKWSRQSGVWTTGNDEFLLKEYNSKTELIKCLDLDQDDEDKLLGNICNVEEDTWCKYRYMHIRIIPAVE